MTRRILLVDDDARIREALAEALASSGVVVEVAESGEQALAAIARELPDVVLSDVRMPGLGGLDLLSLLRERAPSVDVVLMTAYDDMTTVVTAMRDGAVEFLAKPLDLHELRRLLDRIFADRRTRGSRRTDAPAPGSPEDYAAVGLVGHDPAMIGVYKRVGQAAASRATVLVRGDSGTGKELIARAIHASSPESAAPFIAVNCAALPPTLLESELFGHVKGSFTGANADRKGRFALAGRGTLFLDEIGDTSPDLQAKLLRVLQEREYYPVGAERPERTEARVIAATHRDLEALVAAEQFRTDLYYRLRVLEIAVPPLRERVNDLPLLAEHFLRRLRAEDHPPQMLSREALQVLTRHSWPGNVRELENTLTRAAALATGDVIRAEHIELGPVPGNGRASLLTLELLERSHIERVLCATGGQKVSAARILGISRPRLDRLLRKHGLA